MVLRITCSVDFKEQRTGLRELNILIFSPSQLASVASPLMKIHLWVAQGVVVELRRGSFHFLDPRTTWWIHNACTDAS